MLRHCPVCQRAHENRSRFSRDEWVLRECPATGLLYLENPPGYVALESEYAFEVTMEQERARRRQAEPLWSGLSAFMKRLRLRLLPKRNKFLRLTRQTWIACGRPAEFRVLDVGCGFGNMLEGITTAFAAEGVRVIPFGVEISKELSRISGERLARQGGHLSLEEAARRAPLPEQIADAARERGDRHELERTLDVRGARDVSEVEAHARAAEVPREVPGRGRVSELIAALD